MTDSRDREDWKLIVRLTERAGFNTKLAVERWLFADGEFPGDPILDQMLLVLEDLERRGK